MKRLLVSLALFIAVISMAPAVASAYNPLGGACGAGSGASSSTACQSVNSQNAKGGPVTIIRKVTTIVAIIAGVAAVIMVIVGGFQYITSAGDAQQAEEARSTVIGAAIGLVIIVAAQSIILFVLSKV